MNYENLITLTLERFPDLIPQYEEDKFYLEGLNHLFFAHIFVLYIYKIVEENNVKEINNTFHYLEEMIICNDLMVVEVAMASVLENIYSDKYNDLDNYKKYFFSNTLKKFEII